MSLYRTGEVRSYYPTQSFSREHVVQNKGWWGSRGHTDFTAYRYGSTEAAHGAACGIVCNAVIEPPGGEVMAFNTNADSPYPAATVGNAAWGKFADGNRRYNSDAMSFYEDTGHEMPNRLAPYILVRSRPMLQKGGSIMDIYHQVTVHYESWWEVEEMSNVFGGPYVPIRYTYLYNEPTGTTDVETEDRKMGQMMGTSLNVGPCDNIVGRIIIPRACDGAYI